MAGFAENLSEIPPVGAGNPGDDAAEILVGPDIGKDDGAVADKA